MVIIKSKQVVDIKQDAGLSKDKVKKVVTKSPVINYQWVKDKIDTRDYQYIPSIQPLPAKVDFRPKCTLIENQGQLGSCTGNAIAGAIELLNNQAGKAKDISRLYIYYYERVLENTVNYDNGAYIRDGIKACSKYGASLESLWPYDITKYTNAPTPTAIADGLKRKITRYERTTDYNGCKDALAHGYSVIIGFTVYSSFLSTSTASTGVMTYPNKKTERILGGHAVLLVGYDDAKSCFIVRNSWGTGWGDKGYFYMPYEVIQDKTMSSDFWIIKSVDNP